MTLSIHDELRDMSLAVKQPVLNLLTALGVPRLTIAQMGARHYFGGTARVIDSDDGLYAPSDEGRPHFILPVFEDEELVDLVAFASDAPMSWLLRLGSGWSLGLIDGFERHSWEPEVRLWVSPLDWLRADRTGLCVLDWSAPEVLELASLPNIRCQDRILSERLKQALSRRYRVPEITYGEELRHAA